MRLNRLLAPSLFLLIITFASSVLAQPPRPNFNRAQTYDVQHYVIRVSFDRAAKKVIGDTTVQLKPLQSGFTSVELDAHGLVFESVAAEPSGLLLKYLSAANKVIVTLDKAYSPDELISLRFKYTATPKKGVYFIDEEIENGKQVRSAQIWTQGEPDEARHWFPSFDFPSDKATTEQFITARSGEKVIGNGEMVEGTPNSDGTVTFHYKMPVPHSTYLVSFVIGNYVKVPGKYRDIPLGFYVYPGTEPIVPKAYGNTVEMFRIFEELTGVDYPFNKYDQTIVSGFTFGGMENITATTMADTDIFLSNFAFGKSAVENLVSHELAHSWFGNLVTCKNWAELWLNEGFATFMEAAYLEKKHGRQIYINKIVSDAEIFIADDAVNTKRNGLFNRNAANVSALFDRPATTYNKGGAIIHTLRETVGDEAFWKAINIYLNRHKFGSVESTDLQKVMEETSGQDLKWFFDQWVYGTGAPKLDVKPVYSPRTKTLKLTVSQTQSGALTPAVFRLPMDVEIKTARGTSTEKLNVTKLVETFTFRLGGKPESIAVDSSQRVPIKTVKLRPIISLK